MSDDREDTTLYMAAINDEGCVGEPGRRLTAPRASIALVAGAPAAVVPVPASIGPKRAAEALRLAIFPAIVGAGDRSTALAGVASLGAAIGIAMAAAVPALSVGGGGDRDEGRAERGGKNEDTHVTLLLVPLSEQGENEPAIRDVA